MTNNSSIKGFENYDTNNKDFHPSTNIITADNKSDII